MPKRFLPAEYGGAAGSMQSLIDSWEKKLLESHEELSAWQQYGSNELLRPGAPVTEETLLSMTSGSIF